MVAVNSDEDGAKLFYVDGPDGTGKTLYNTLILTLRARGHSIISVAFTGITAVLMESRQTVHKAFVTIRDINRRFHIEHPFAVCVITGHPRSANVSGHIVYSGQSVVEVPNGHLAFLWRQTSPLWR